VPLHPYQLQSLAFMQEAEKLEGGWRQLLWRWLPSQPQRQQQQGQASSSVGVRGQGMWWSPVLDRLSFSVPPAPWGGFLGEQFHEQISCSATGYGYFGVEYRLLLVLVLIWLQKAG
jgi:hypothetical protein